MIPRHITPYQLHCIGLDIIIHSINSIIPELCSSRYHPVFNFIFGGVTALSRENYVNVNGYANRYAGWGNEDDDMSARTIGAGKLPTITHNHYTIPPPAACTVR